MNVGALAEIASSTKLCNELVDRGELDSRFMPLLSHSLASELKLNKQSVLNKALDNMEHTSWRYPAVDQTIGLT